MANGVPEMAGERLNLVEDDDRVAEVVEPLLILRPGVHEREEELIEGRQDDVGAPGVQAELGAIAIAIVCFEIAVVAHGQGVAHREGLVVAIARDFEYFAVHLRGLLDDREEGEHDEDLGPHPGPLLHAMA